MTTTTIIKETLNGKMLLIEESPACANDYKQHLWEYTIERPISRGIVDFAYCHHCNMTRQRWLTFVFPNLYYVRKEIYSERLIQEEQEKELIQC